MGAYKYIREAWKKPDKKAQHERCIQWRAEPRFKRLVKPTRVDRARALGYKAKPGFVVVRARLTTGAKKSPRLKSGRKPRARGMFFYPGKNLRAIAEARVQRKYPNLEVLNSYWVGTDAKQKWYEVILVNTGHPQIRADKDINWIVYRQHTRRAYRGLTSAGRKHRGLRK